PLSTPESVEPSTFSEILFFQAEDGIRDFHVTGVQTCALPISECCSSARIGYGFNTYCHRFKRQEKTESTLFEESQCQSAPETKSLITLQERQQGSCRSPT